MRPRPGTVLSAGCALCLLAVAGCMLPQPARAAAAGCVGAVAVAGVLALSVCWLRPAALPPSARPAAVTHSAAGVGRLADMPPSRPADPYSPLPPARDNRPPSPDAAFEEFAAEHESEFTS